MRVLLTSLVLFYAIPSMGSAQYIFTEQDSSATYVDATSMLVPQAPDLNTLDAVFVDVNNDGILDVVIAVEYGVNRLYMNDWTGNGDQKPDILFLNLTSNNRDWDKDPQARLLINDGHGRFRDETEERMPKNRFSSWGGAIVDFNHDGHPDILIGAIQVPGFVPLQLRAYQNDGKGNFTDVTLDIVPQNTVGRHWGMAVGDLNGDGKDDVFIGGWGTQARLLLSR